MKVKWPAGKSMTKFRADVKKHLQEILYGKVLVLDPASHRLGYAVIKGGYIPTHGIIEIPKGTAANRLGCLVDILQEEGTYDIVAVEKIRGSRAHIVLKWAVGCVIGAVQTNHHIEVPVNVWKAWAGPEHEKDDDADALAMAETLLEVAIEENT